MRQYYPCAAPRAALLSASCRYAVQDKGRVTGSGRERWEIPLSSQTRPDVEGQTGSTVDCAHTACCCVTPQAENDGLLELTLAAKYRCC